MNNVCLSGSILSPPKISYTQKNVCRAAFLLGVPRSRGRDKPEDFFSVIAWGAEAEKIRDYCSTDERLELTGKLQTSSFERGGEKVYRTEIVAEKVFLIDRKKEMKLADDND